MKHQDQVTIRRPKKATLNVGGRPEYEQVLDADEDAVVVRCSFDEKSSMTIDARGAQRRTDGTLVYNPEGLATLQNGDIVVRSGNEAYEVVDHQAVTIRGTAIKAGRAGLIKTKIEVQEDLHGR